MQTSIFIFMAGDNNLDFSGTNDLKEMLQADIADNINLLVQFDRRKSMPWEDSADNTTKRILIKNKEQVLLQDIGETNTGDPLVLKDFLEWGTKNYPAERNIVIIWNHGGGIKDNDIYKSILPKAKSNLFVPMKDRANGRLGKKILNKDEREKLKILDDLLNIPDRLVCTDDTSRDFLDNSELKSALSLGKKKFDIIAFDACLMNMFEIMYQLKDRADYIIGSEEIEPADGWGYKSVLDFLSANLSLPSKGLAQKIVDIYKTSYKGKEKEITQSSVSLFTIESVAFKLDSFATILNSSISLIKSDLFEILSTTQKFRESDYIDLCDFVHLIKNNISHEQIQLAAGELLTSLQGMIIANATIGKGVENANGISIYFPSKKPDADTLKMYSELDFNLKYPGWIKLINLYYAPKVEIRR